MKTVAAFGLALMCASGCRLFPPADPETPAILGEVEVALEPEELPDLWVRSLRTENLSQAQIILDSGFRLVPAPDVGDAGAEIDRMADLFRDHDTDTVWAEIESRISSSDSARMVVRYGIDLDDRTPIRGRATWRATRGGDGLWRLSSWDDSPLSTGLSWSAYWGGEPR